MRSEAALAEAALGEAALAEAAPAASAGPSRTLVAVSPAGARARRRRLFDALEEAYPIRFDDAVAALPGQADAVLSFGAGYTGGGGADALPSLQLGEAERSGPTRTLALADHPALARPLRGARLSERHATGLRPLLPSRAEVTLGSLDGDPVWTSECGGGRSRVALAPAELEQGESLRSRLAPGRCLATLALVQFAQVLTARSRFAEPPTRAAFVIDDPNLRRPSYGHLDYRELARSASAHGYHVSIATVPLDGWLPDERVAAIFRGDPDHLSLCIHGNDHDGPELGRPRSLAEGLRPASQALRRCASLERRAGVQIDRVMVAPHEELSEAASMALLACGYEAASGSRPYPWIRSSPDLRWLTRPAGAGALVGWRSTELLPGGLPLLLRMDFGHPREELAIRAFLGQPLIVYGHHDDLAGGPGLLEELAAEIARLGDVRWSSLAGIARAAAQTRRRGELLEVRMLGRRICVDVPEGVHEVHVEAGALEPSAHARLLAPGLEPRLAPIAAGASLRVPEAGHAAGRSQLELTLDDPALDPQLPPLARPRLSARLRRLAGEARDRSAPIRGAIWR